MSHASRGLCVLLMLTSFGCEGSVIQYENGRSPAVVGEMGALDQSHTSDLSHAQDQGDALFDMSVLPVEDFGAQDLVQFGEEDMRVEVDMRMVEDMAREEDMRMAPDLPPPTPDMAPPPDPDAFDLNKVKWLDPDISSWSESATLSSVTFERQGRDICLNYRIPGGGTWPVVQIFGSTDVVANAWVFIFQDGEWHGATWEWMRPGQTCKAITSVAGDHIKKNPFGQNSGWVPTSGQEYYFMVSGLIRNNMYHNVSERTNVVRVVWP